MAEAMLAVNAPPAAGSIHVVSVSAGPADTAAPEGSAVLSFASLLSQGIAAQNVPGDAVKLAAKSAEPSDSNAPGENLLQPVAEGVDPALLPGMMPVIPAVFVPQHGVALSGKTEGRSVVAHVDVLLQSTSVGAADGGVLLMAKSGTPALRGEAAVPVMFDALKNRVAEPDRAANFAVADLSVAGGAANTAQVVAPNGGLQLALPQQSAVAAVSGAVQQQPAIALPVNAQGWDNAVGQRMLWMVGQQQQVAQLQLNPAHLGPMEIQLSIHNGEANAVFVSAHAPVREAIETALPRLREMLSDSGINLVNVNVSSQDAQRDQTAFAGRQGQSGRGGDAVEVPVSSVVSALPQSSGVWQRGMVDTFV